MSLFREEHGRVSAPNGIQRLPSASATAVHVLALAQRPPSGVAELLRVVQGDPATVLALLQAAGRGCPAHDRCTSVRSAIETLGVHRALRICLRFRLLDRRSAGGVDFIGRWRQALLTSAYACAIARRLRRADWECIQTAAVLRSFAAPIAERPARSDPAAAAETGSGWLVALGVSSVICDLVSASRMEAVSMEGADQAAACIVLAMNMADVWLRADWELTAVRTEALAHRLFGAIPDLCAWVFGVLGPQAAELETLLQIDYPSRRKIFELYRTARRLRSADRI